MAKILVVDDDESVVFVVKRILEGAGHDVTTALSGEEALEVVAKEIPDLITLDIMMPGIDGFETLAKLKQDAKVFRVPVIMISVKNDEADIVRGIHLGATDYFTKPYNETILLAKVKAILKAKEMEKEIIEYSKDLEQKVEEKTKDLKDAHDKLEKAHDKLKIQYHFLEKDLDLANLQMEHDEKKITFIGGLTGIFTLVLISSLIILITTWNIDYLIGLVGVGIILSAIHISRSQKSMRETKNKINNILKKKLDL